jgi:hypothetical protein
LLPEAPDPGDAHRRKSREPKEAQMLEPMMRWWVGLQVAAQSLVERAKGEGEEG